MKQTFNLIYGEEWLIQAQTICMFEKIFADNPHSELRFTCLQNVLQTIIKRSAPMQPAMVNIFSLKAQVSLFSYSFICTV